MKKTLLSAMCLALLSLSLGAQNPGGGQPDMAMMRRFFRNEPQKVKLAPEGPINSTAEKIDFDECVLEIYQAMNPNGICVLEFPGGGYSTLSMTHEGRDFAKWFNARGITYCMLQYRLPKGVHNGPLNDAELAINYLKDHADELKITKLGVMGTSAGGHLASTVATHYSSERTRPEFQILVYPVTTMDLQYTHKPSREYLLGKDASQELVDLYSNDLQVTDQTPRAFIVLASDDFLVPVENSTRYYEALVKHKVSATLLCYPKGGHGFGNNETFRYRNNWLDELETWINVELR